MIIIIICCSTSRITPYVITVFENNSKMPLIQLLYLIYGYVTVV